MSTVDRDRPNPSTDPAWEIVIGLEVHCELRTATKLFCGCRNSFGEEPNTSVCPVCLGLPGSLPVLNRTAVDYAMRIGTALHCRVQPSQFHRKNYFYPDMPKDYQISQYDVPINADGWLDLPDGGRIGIIRAHLEEDTGKTTHVGGGGRIHDAAHSLVDYNRAGVPLVEIVSAPDIRSAEEARAYVDELRAILVATGASDGKMEEGSLRVDANVSVRPAGSTDFGTRCEIKNMNSLRSLGRAIEYEAARQMALISEGGTVAQETRHWDEGGGRTGSMRSKEEAYDYRYFPEPDLVPLEPSEDWVAAVATSLPRLPADRRAAVAEASGLPAGSDAVATVVRLGLDHLVDAVVSAAGPPDAPSVAVRRLANEVAADPEAAASLDPASFARLVGMEAGGALTAAQARTVLKAIMDRGGEPEAIASELGFEAMDVSDLEAVVEEIISAHPDEWSRFEAGEDKLTGFFIGKVKAATDGKADLKAASSILRNRR
ncbi:MAG: Asp-tRNA(Asn)/Glu-tRNA(Gln) amidotransferase subunit GatB [Acidimicrobiales bacterium]|nr:Asp-tRNA(Asn)/Glu-tRNA(Gln) amidotransferase subunit GatB [Acidimicrobiales bacterium]